LSLPHSNYKKIVFSLSKVEILINKFRKQQEAQSSHLGKAMVTDALGAHFLGKNRLGIIFLTLIILLKPRT